MSDLIGTKRPSHARSFRQWATILTLLSVSLVIAFLLYRRVSSYAHPDGAVSKGSLHVIATAPEEGLKFGGGSLRYQGRLGILHTGGTPNEIGTQHGRLLATEIQTIQKVFQENIEQTVSRAGIFGNWLHNIRLRWRWRTLDDGIPGHQLVEVAGLVRGAMRSGTTIGYESQVRQSALLDVGAAARGSSGQDLWTIARSLTVLAPIQSSASQGLLVARMLSLPGSSDGGRHVRQHPILHVSRPTGTLAYASLAWPGLIGVLSGVNAERIGVFVHFVKTSDVRLTREAQPSALIAQEVLEHAHSLDEAIAILKKATPLGSAVYVLVDGSERTWARVERSPSKTSVERGSNAQTIVDAFVSDKFKDDAINDRSQRARPMRERQARAKALLRQPRKSPADVVSLLRDRKSPDGGMLVLGHRAALDDTDSVHSALFDVSGLVVWISDTGDASGAFRAVDLRHELLASSTGTSRPAPPADVSESGSESGARVAVRKARQLILLARRANKEGKTRRARELAAAALAVAPSLPEALLVAGQMARNAGDALAARALLQRYLEFGSDDPRSREQVQVWLGQN